VLAKGNPMTQDEFQSDANRPSARPEQRLEEIQTEQSSLQTPQTQASAPNSPPQSAQRAAPGRRPLFRS